MALGFKKADRKPFGEAPEGFYGPWWKSHPNLVFPNYISLRLTRTEVERVPVVPNPVSRDVELAAYAVMLLLAAFISLMEFSLTGGSNSYVLVGMAVLALPTFLIFRRKREVQKRLASEHAAILREFEEKGLVLRIPYDRLSIQEQPGFDWALWAFYPLTPGHDQIRYDLANHLAAYLDARSKGQDRKAEKSLAAATLLARKAPAPEI